MPTTTRIGSVALPACLKTDGPDFGVWGAEGPPRAFACDESGTASNIKIKATMLVGVARAGTLNPVGGNVPQNAPGVFSQTFVDSVSAITPIEVRNNAFGFRWQLTDVADNDGPILVASDWGFDAGGDQVPPGATILSASFRVTNDLSGGLAAALVTVVQMAVVWTSSQPTPAWCLIPGSRRHKRKGK